MMKKTDVIKDLKFILSKFGYELERELYPITDDELHESLDEFKNFVNEIVANTECQLVKQDYSENEYSKILLSKIQEIENTPLFQDLSGKD